jgi:spore germination protein KA
LTNEKPLVVVKRKKKTVRDQKNRENKDPLQDKEWKLEDVKDKIFTVLGQTVDLKMDHIKIAETDGMLFFLESTVETALLKESFMNKKMFQTKHEFDLTTKEGLTEFFQQEFGGTGFQLVQTVDEVVTAMLDGSIGIVIKSCSFMIIIGMGNTQYRQVAEPTSQTVIRGPKDSFVESLSTNQSLIRRRIRNKNLCFEEFIIGNETKTKVNVVYITGIANEEIIKEIRTRINKINVSAIFESANIEELIADKTITLFPLALNTERPDTVAGNLIEGKIGIIVDGTPFVLLVPAVFTDFFVSSEDYYHNFFVSSFIRILRYISFMIVLITPAAYVGLLTYNQEMIPTNLLISIVAQRQGVPFPAFVEVFIMEFTFEILREAGIRMPRAVGQTVSIVGALVVGQAAAQAGLISNIMIIIVAITATANFVAPVYSLAATTRILRFALIIISAFFGLYGVLLGLIVMVTHLASLRSLGVPYLAPVAPLSLKEQKDVFILFPFWSMNRRPSYLRSPQQEKQQKTISPSPPDMIGGNDR